ncbi:MAG: hypothetical protein HQK65_05850 [Desulfamplus sp.]|nr:hypothetical protein [Desulfamplus sp.]
MGHFIFILGMHRSGTSCLAGALERCGLYLGNVRRTGKFNAKGYYEIKAVQQIHDQILGLNLGTWCAPPQKVLVHPFHRKAIEKIAVQLSRRPPCGLKDPRLILLLEAWLDIVPIPYLLVGTFRHPQAVAQSLARRNGIPEEEGYKLWLHYNSALMQNHQAHKFPLVEFDLSNMTIYCHIIAALALKLGLNPDLSQLHEFISPELVHHHPDQLTVPLICREVYAYLQRYCFGSADIPDQFVWSKTIGQSAIA